MKKGKKLQAFLLINKSRVYKLTCGFCTQTTVMRVKSLKEFNNSIQEIKVLKFTA